MLDNKHYDVFFLLMRIGQFCFGNKIFILHVIELEFRPDAVRVVRMRSHWEIQ